jgi:ketosteroid isomerase-like protein
MRKEWLGGVILLIALVTVIGMRPAELKPRSISISSAANSSAVAQIQQKVDGFRHSVLTMSMPGMANYYWNSPDVVVFDVVPPLRYVGWDSFRQDWQGFFDSFEKISVYDWTDVHIEAEGDMGWMRALVHMVGTFKDGKSIDMAFRDTAIFERKGGKWVVVHDHGSVPIEFETQKAIFNAPPQ